MVAQKKQVLVQIIVKFWQRGRILHTVPAIIGSAIIALFGTPATDIKAVVEASVNGAIYSLVMGLRNDSSGTRQR
ncbi:hypothetical protein TSAR_003545 [Trichomalopsis sarcophagae]|uniref:Uncharacterized protein n=1 Tax=Trichomalopsis sarcophagae TaxID=543379 RepID=A0A232FEJ1_9HYME|nr:hypothetical protein TSAR_003545 [Trichomalopsis sarcophagae]